MINRKYPARASAISHHDEIEYAYRQKAEQMWAAFTDNEKTTVRCGMFPEDKMRSAEREGFMDGRQLCAALKAMARADGGMRGHDVPRVH